MSQSLQRHKINRPFIISSPAGGFPLPKKFPISCKEIYNPTVLGPLPTSCCSLPHQLSGSSWQSLGSLDMLNFLLGSNHTWQSLTLECFADLEYSFLPDAPLHAPKLAVRVYNNAWDSVGAQTTSWHEPITPHSYLQNSLGSLCLLPHAHSSYSHSAVT